MRRQTHEAARQAPDQGGLRICLLGEVEVRRDGRALALPASKKTRALLAYLCATGRAQHREALCELLWDGPDDPRAALRWSLSKIRPLFDQEGDGGGDGAGGCRLSADRERVTFQAEPDAVDLWQVRALMAAGISDAPTERLRAAAGQFRGPFLEGLELTGCHRFAAWAVAEREAVRGAHVAVLAALVARLAGVAAGEALVHARALVALDPLVESSHVTVVRLLAAMGRAHDAIEQYDRCRRILASELGTRPSPELEQLRMSLTTGAAPPSSSVPEAPARALEMETGSAAPAGVDGSLLVGRERERAVIHAMLDDAQAGRGHEVLLVLGDPGVGKTRILEELRATAVARGGRVFYGRAYEAELVRPYSGFTDALRETPLFGEGGAAHAARAPVLPQPGATARDADHHQLRHRLFDAVASFLRDLAGAPVVLMIDDIQWLDEASAALLHYLARTLAATPLLLAMAARAGELADNAAARRLVRGLDQDRRLRRLPLDPLDNGAIADLVRAAVPGVDAERAVADSGGNPLFALEVARSQAAGAEHGSATLPGLIAERLDRLGESGRRVLPWAAALGRSFDPDVLARVTALPASELLDALETFERHGVMRAAGGGSYDFVHDLIRQAAYRQMSEPRRRLVHLQIARALGSLPDGDGALAGDIAHHAGLGGDHALAVGACLRAAERCLRLFAHAEAAEVASRGLTHAAQLPREARLHMQIALLGRLAVNPRCRGARGREVGAALSRAAEEARAAGLEPDAAIGLYARAVIEYDEGRLNAAYETTVQAAVQRRSADPVMAADQMSSMARCLIYVEKDVARAETMIAEAQALAGAQGDDIESLVAAAAMMGHYQGDEAAAGEGWRRALVLARRREDRWEECDCLMRITLIAFESGDARAALDRSGSLLEAARRMGEGTELAVAETLAALARYALDDAAAAGDLERTIAKLRELDAKGLLALALNLAAGIDLDAARPALARDRAQQALAAAAAVERWSQVALARATLARLAAAAGDRRAAAELLSPLAPHLAQRLGVSQRARRAAAVAFAAIELPIPTPGGGP